MDINNHCELAPELLGILALNPFYRHTSASRGQMFSSHIGQRLCLLNPTPRKIHSGIETELAKTTFNIKMEKDSLVHAIIPRYPKTASKEIFAFNPQTIIIYEEIETGHIGMLDIALFCSHHQHFGFDYKFTDEYKNLSVNDYVSAGTVFAESNCVANNTWMYGRELKMAVMSDAGVAEDGIWISKQALTKLAFKMWERRALEYGSTKFPTNAYGTKEIFKGFPDIGDYLTPDGVLMNFRDHDKFLSVVEQSADALLNIDTDFDRTIYVPFGGRVVDIKIQHDEHQGSSLPAGMEEQPLKYNRAKINFYNRIKDVYKELKRKRPGGLTLTPDMHRLIIEMMSVLWNDSKKLMRLHRRVPLDDFRLEFIVEQIVIPTAGFKLTDTHGGKGVIVKITDESDMPRDMDGNIADIVMDDNSTVDRENLGRLYELYINSAATHVENKFATDILQIDRKDVNQVQEVKNKLSIDKQFKDKCFDYLLNFYSLFSTPMVELLTDRNNVSEQDRITYIHNVIDNGISPYIPPDNPMNDPESINRIENSIYRPNYGPVTYRSQSGEMVTTKNNVRIGSVYFMLLEKIGDDRASVSSGKQQQYGVLTQTTRADKYTSPARNNPTRTWGEAEIRILVSYCGVEATAELMDRNNSPDTHNVAVQTLLYTPNVVNIPTLVDRTKHIFGTAKPIQLADHMLFIRGIRMVYDKPD